MAVEEEPQDKSRQAGVSKSRTIILACVGLAFVVVVAVFVKTLMFPNGEAVIEGVGLEGGDRALVTEPGEVLQMWEILVNLAKPDQDIYISVKIAVELNAPVGSREARELSKELHARKIEFKQIVEEVLQSRTRDDLLSETGREGTRQEMLRKINARLQKGKLRKILTTDMLFS